MFLCSAAITYNKRKYTIYKLSVYAESGNMKDLYIKKNKRGLIITQSRLYKILLLFLFFNHDFVVKAMAK
jgi:hypothetical protein